MCKNLDVSIDVLYICIFFVMYWRILKPRAYCVMSELLTVLNNRRLDCYILGGHDPKVSLANHLYCCTTVGLVGDTVQYWDPKSFCNKFSAVIIRLRLPPGLAPSVHLWAAKVVLVESFLIQTKWLSTGILIIIRTSLSMHTAWLMVLGRTSTMTASSGRRARGLRMHLVASYRSNL